VPLMALIISPTLAAAIMLPLLIMMDIIVIYQFRRTFNRQHLLALIPFATFGVLLGYLSISTFSDDDLRILVGVIAVVFGIHNIYNTIKSKPTPKSVYSASNATQTVKTTLKMKDRLSGLVWGSISGFASFHVHAGGPPASVYLLPKKMTPMVYAGTTGILFSIINFIKLPAYLATGQITKVSLIVSAVLLPFVPISVAIGYRLVQKVNVKPYYTFISLMLIVIGLQMIYFALV